MECVREAVVYSKPGCPQCVQAKNMLVANNICFTEMMFGTDYTIEDLHEAVGHPVRAVPQIFLDGTHINTLQMLRDILENKL